MASPNAITPEQSEMLVAYERGLRLQDTVNSHGWQDVLDIMEAEVARAEFHLMNYNGTDAAIVLALQRRARGMREFFQSVQIKIQSAVNEIDAIQKAESNPQLVAPVEAGEGW